MKTPTGSAKWLDIVTPKVYGGGQPTDAEPGRYQATIMLDPDQDSTQQFLDDLRRAADDAFEAKMEEMGRPKGHKKLEDGFLPVTDDTDKEGRETGMLLVKAGCKAGGLRKDKTPWKKRIPITYRSTADKEAAEESGAAPGYGSKIRFSFDLLPYEMQGTKMWRISLQLRAVHVVDYVPAGGNNTENDFADEAEEDFE